MSSLSEIRKETGKSATRDWNSWTDYNAYNRFKLFWNLWKPLLQILLQLGGKMSKVQFQKREDK